MKIKKMQITKGQRLKISDLTKSEKLTAKIFIESQENIEFDFICFALNEFDKCKNDESMIFYNQPKLDDSIILSNYSNNSCVFEINLNKLDQNIKKIVFTSSANNSDFSKIKSFSFFLFENSNLICDFTNSGELFKKEKSLMILEFYFKDVWRLRGISDGFNGGISDLLENFGLQENVNNENKPKDNKISLPRIITHNSNSVQENQASILNENKTSSVFGFLKKVVKAPIEYINKQKEIIAKEQQRILDEIEKVRSGDVEPILDHGLIVKVSELVWYKTSNISFKYYLKKDPYAKYEYGELFITSDRIVFRSTYFPIELLLKNLLDINAYHGSIIISGKNKNQVFEFKTKESFLIEAYIRQAVGKFHRTQDFSNSSTATNTRHIKQTVKSAVWIRDQGKCVECRSKDYLEYDHIIPHSKGGANSENNIQLLCRRCNLNKSDRI
jgi:stress response protein SCP2